MTDFLLRYTSSSLAAACIFVYVHFFFIQIIISHSIIILCGTKDDFANSVWQKGEEGENTQDRDIVGHIWLAVNVLISEELPTAHVISHRIYIWMRTTTTGLYKGISIK